MLTTCVTCGTAPAKPPTLKYCSQACYLADARQKADNSLVARFWAKVQTSDDPHGCWLWTAGTIKGYGQFHLRRNGDAQQTIYAHRFAWTMTNGPIVDNLSVLHRCDVPLCVRPDHLFLGTQQDNLTDARQKGRLIDGLHLIKLSDAALADIRANYRYGNSRQLAAKHGVTQATISRVVRGLQRVKRPVFERVPSVQLDIRGEVA